MTHLLEQQRTHKRGAADAFSDESQGPSSTTGSTPGSGLVAYNDPSIPGPSAGEMNAMMAEMLGFDVPAMQSAANQGSHMWLGELSDASRTLAGFNFESFTRSNLG